jgi:hypothetical protein
MNERRPWRPDIDEDKILNPFEPAGGSQPDEPTELEDEEGEGEEEDEPSK